MIIKMLTNKLKNKIKINNINKSQNNNLKA